MIFMPSKKTKKPAKAEKKPFLKKKSLGKRKAKKKQAGLVTGKITFAELTSRHRAAIPILFEYGLHCIGCHVSALETIEQGALAHGLSKEQLSEMLEKINNTAKILKN
jgi:hybrid cluster-associated redox disulfide protein